MRGEIAEIARWMTLAVGAAVVASVCAAAILFVGSPNPGTSNISASNETARAAAPDGNSDRSPEPKPRREALLADARWYAKDNGVSVKEAARRLDMQDEPFLSHLHHVLERDAPDTYAELRLRHRPDFGITLAFTGDSRAAREKVKPHIEGTRWEGTVEIDRVELTDTELLAISEEAGGILDRTGVEYSSSINISRSCVEFHVPDKAAFERKLHDSELELPDHIVVKEGVGFPLVSP